jgi:hypothetical protein
VAVGAISGDIHIAGLRCVNRVPAQEWGQNSRRCGKGVGWSGKFTCCWDDARTFALRSRQGTSPGSSCTQCQQCQVKKKHWRRGRNRCTSSTHWYMRRRLQLKEVGGHSGHTEDPTLTSRCSCARVSSQSNIVSHKERRTCFLFLDQRRWRKLAYNSVTCGSRCGRARRAYSECRCGCRRARCRTGGSHALAACRGHAPRW